MKIVVQKCEYNLKAYLRSNVIFQETYNTVSIHFYEKQFKETFCVDVRRNKHINLLHLISYNFQIANGMNFLAQADVSSSDFGILYF